MARPRLTAPERRLLVHLARAGGSLAAEELRRRRVLVDTVRRLIDSGFVTFNEGPDDIELTPAGAELVTTPGQ